MSETTQLPAEVDSIDSVPEAFRPAYSRAGEDGPFVLNVKPVNGRSLDTVGALKATISSAREEVKALERKLAAFGDLDPDIARKAIKKTAEMKDWKPDDKVKEQIAAQVQQVTDKYEKALGEKDNRTKMLEGEVHRLVVRDAVAAAIREDNAQNNVDLLLPHVMASVKPVEEDGRFVARVFAADGKTPLITGKQGSTDPMPLKEFVATLKEDNRYAPAFFGSGASGGGTPPLGGGGGGGGGPGPIRLSRSEAQDVTRYRHAREAAEKQGTTVEIIDD